MCNTEDDILNKIQECLEESDLVKNYKSMESKIRKFLSESKEIYQDDTENENGNEYFDIIKYNDSSNDQEINKYLNSQQVKERESQLLLIIIVYNMKDFFKITQLVANAKNIRGCYKKNIQCKYILATVKDRNETISIGIDSRIKTIEQSIEIGSTVIDSYVFKANVKDIINIYNKFGIQLFNDNLRAHISEKNEVESSIKATLEDNPDKFWFFNNGISMIVKNVEGIWKQPSKLKLKLYCNNNDENISIINGAQTISALAEYYYEKSKDTEYSEEKDPKVLLRLYTINKDNKDNEDNKEVMDFFKEITTSLNRQKPIKTEDIFILDENIEEWNSLENKQFTISKRGSNKGYINTSEVDSANIELKLFLKLIAMFMGWPGTARNKSIKYITKQLLKENRGNEEGNGNYIFQTICNENREGKEWQEQQEIINCIYYLKNIYDNYDSLNGSITSIRSIRSGSNFNSVLEYTKTLFVSFICYIAIYYDEKRRKIESKDSTDIYNSIKKLDNKINQLVRNIKSIDNQLKSIDNQLKSIDNQLKSADNKLNQDKYNNILDKYNNILDEYDNITEKDDYKIIEIFENAVKELSDEKLDSNYFKKDDYYADFKIKVDTELKSM